MTPTGPNRVVAEGITAPPIDDLLGKADSKYRLVLFAAKRARQINAYYAQLGEGLLEYVGPLVETHVQEKPLSIALREIDEGLITVDDIDPAQAAEGEETSSPLGPPVLSAVPSPVEVDDADDVADLSGDDTESPAAG